MNEIEQALKYFKSRKAMMLADMVQHYEDIAITAIEQLQVNKWIPVSERLPENNKVVLIYAMSMSRGGCIYTIGSCDNNCWFTESGLGLLSYPNGNNYEALEWMSLPDPHKGTEEEHA